MGTFGVPYSASHTWSATFGTVPPISPDSLWVFLPLRGTWSPACVPGACMPVPSPLVLLCPPCGPRDSPRGSLPLPRLYEPPGQIDSPLASHLMFRTACLLRSLVEPPKGRGSDSFLLLCPHTWHSMWHVATPGKPVILS